MRLRCVLNLPSPTFYSFFLSFRLPAAAATAAGYLLGGYHEKAVSFRRIGFAGGRLDRLRGGIFRTCCHASPHTDARRHGRP